MVFELGSVTWGNISTRKKLGMKKLASRSWGPPLGMPPKNVGLYHNCNGNYGLDKYPSSWVMREISHLDMHSQCTDIRWLLVSACPSWHLKLYLYRDFVNFVKLYFNLTCTKGDFVWLSNACVVGAAQSRKHSQSGYLHLVSHITDNPVWIPPYWLNSHVFEQCMLIFCSCYFEFPIGSVMWGKTMCGREKTHQ